MQEGPGKTSSPTEREGGEGIIIEEIIIELTLNALYFILLKPKEIVTYVWKLVQCEILSQQQEMWHLCLFTLHISLIPCVVIAMLVENCDREGLIEGDEWRDEVFSVHQCWRRGTLRPHTNPKGGDVVPAPRNQVSFSHKSS